MSKIVTTPEAMIAKIESAITGIKNGYSTQYISFYNSDDELCKVRVGNHRANPERMNDTDFSLIVNVPGGDDSEVYINKKSFANNCNQEEVNDDNTIGYFQQSIAEWVEEYITFCEEEA